MAIILSTGVYKTIGKGMFSTSPIHCTHVEFIFRSFLIKGAIYPAPLIKKLLKNKFMLMSPYNQQMKMYSVGL
ncbi:hypothetical protein XELAEV_18030794mg [Xenopus laevis]|uniref:Uncharacterized protein n=1 Tax=Xenopus laevis TaxID=8355 RepID=A0A974CLD5_XENLA|nr:hypothetical protein XELAEV_18030794mg [Xenopus laevis]